MCLLGPLPGESKETTEQVQNRVRIYLRGQLCSFGAVVSVYHDPNQFLGAMMQATCCGVPPDFVFTDGQAIRNGKGISFSHRELERWFRLSHLAVDFAKELNPPDWIGAPSLMEYHVSYIAQSSSSVFRDGLRRFLHRFFRNSQ